LITIDHNAVVDDAVLLSPMHVSPLLHPVVAAISFEESEEFVFSPMHVGGGVTTVSSGGGNLSPTVNINRPSTTFSPPHNALSRKQQLLAIVYDTVLSDPSLSTGSIINTKLITADMNMRIKDIIFDDPSCNKPLVISNRLLSVATPSSNSSSSGGTATTPVIAQLKDAQKMVVCAHMSLKGKENCNGYVIYQRGSSSNIMLCGPCKQWDEQQQRKPIDYVTSCSYNPKTRNALLTNSQMLSKLRNQQSALKNSHRESCFEFALLQMRPEP
jgi:hypothetical protein